jgi:hypothetical protein
MNFNGRAFLATARQLATPALEQADPDLEAANL